MRVQRFTFLCNENERQAIALLAKQLQRSQSDAVRYVIAIAVQDLLNKNQPNKTALVEKFGGVNKHG